MAEESTKQDEHWETEIVDDVTSESDDAAAKGASNATGTTEDDVSTEPVVEPALDAKGAELANLQEQLLRTRADFDNFRRRTRQEKEELNQFATKKLLTDLLPVVDNFDRAMEAVSEVLDNQFKTGIDMVHRQFQQVLSQYGVKPMETDGQSFDPTLHEAVMQEAVEGTEPGVIVQTLQKGYLIHDRVLRPAMVKVSV